MRHMFFNFQGNAVFGVLAFLGFGFLELVAGVTALVLFARRKRRAARRVVIVSGASAGLYAAVLLVFSLASREQVAGRGDEKYFCEVDCHLAYSVVDVRKSKSLGSGRSRATARGLYRVVTLRVRFDPETHTAPSAAERVPIDADGAIQALGLGPDGAVYVATRTRIGKNLPVRSGRRTSPGDCGGPLEPAHALAAAGRVLYDEAGIRSAREGGVPAAARDGIRLDHPARDWPREQPAAPENELPAQLTFWRRLDAAGREPTAAGQHPMARKPTSTRLGPWFLPFPSGPWLCHGRSPRYGGHLFGS